MDIKRFILALAIVSLFGCAKDSQDPDAGNSFSLNVGNTNCLDNAGAVLQGFFGGTASVADLHGVWGCTQQVLSDFTRYTEGASSDGYTTAELQGFLGKYYFPHGISTASVSTTMKLKAALVGGAPDFVKRSEISRLIQVIGTLDQTTAGLVPVSKILFTDAHLTATDGDWMTAYQKLNEALTQLASIPVQDYAFSDLAALIQAWAAQLSLPSDNFLVKVGTYLPMIGQAKAMLISGSNTTVSSGEWSALFNAIGPIYSYYRMFVRIDRTNLADLLPATRSMWIIQGLVNTLNTAVQRRNGGIPLSEIQTLLTNLQTQGIFPSGFTVAQITSAVQFLLNKVFLASGAATDLVSSGTVAQLQSLVTNWSNYDAALTSGDFSSAADFGAAVKPGGVALMLDSQGRVDFQLRGNGSFHEYSLIYAVVEWIGGKYSSSWPVLQAPFDTAVADFLGMFHTLGWLTATQPSVSTSLMKEANLFVMSSNGDLNLDKAEVFQYAVYVLSSYRASNLLSAASASCNNVDSCITSTWFSNRAALLDNFPNLLSWLGSSTATWTTYSSDVAAVAGSDSWLMQFMVVHFIETYMARFDTDSNQLITVTESLNGFPVFHPILSQILPAQGLAEGDTEPMYTYLFKYGTPPATFGQEIQYFQWKSAQSSWSYNADRLILANILSALDKF